jgi:peptidoglycan hydrolase-like protein with peptidoglycan-binding domain
MDNQTREAIADFQQSNNLPVTGTLDENTATLLGVETSSPSSEPNGAVQNAPRMDEDYETRGRVEQPVDSYSQ